MICRKAKGEDLDDLIIMAEERRNRYKELAPQFWNPASDAAERQREFYAKIIDGTDGLNLIVIEGDLPRGYLMAKIVGHPPVYNPGGPTCFIDDFYVRNADWTGCGRELLIAARSWAKSNGAVQFVIVSGTGDSPKMKFLQQEGLLNTSSWFTGEI